MAQPKQAKPPFGLLIIDRYLLRQFVQTFLICFCSLTGLYIVIDAFNNLEEFINYSRDNGGMLRVMGEYYAYRALTFFDSTSQIVTLIAAMFTVTWIQRHNELTALEAAGISKSRVIKPLVMMALVIVALKVANRELVIPRIREKLASNAQDLGGSRGKPLRPCYDFDTVVLMRSSALTFANEKRIHKPDFRLPQGLDRYGPRLLAENAYYQAPAGDRPGGYLMDAVSEPTGLDTKPSLAMADGRKIILTPLDFPWLQPGQCFVVSAVSFEYLASDQNWRTLSSTLELIRGLQNRSLDYGATERTAIHARLVQPVLDLTLLFLGLPLVLTRSNRNVFLAIGVCLALVVAFMLVVIGCNVLGSGYWIEPALAAWLPLMIFVPCAAVLSAPLRR